MNKKITIAAFDLDGTITKKDTFLEFIKFTQGKMAFYWGFALHSPLLIAYLLKLYPNWKIKQRLFSYYFKGMKHTDFCLKGEAFAKNINKMVYNTALQKMNWHKEQRHAIFIISASIYEWIAPWCKQAGADHILSTTIEIDKNGCLTGKFISKNCYGKEKVKRLMEHYPDKNSYTLYAYGDSRGDRELLSFADIKSYKYFKT